VQDFWSALPRAGLSHSGKVLSLADGTNFLGIDQYGDKLLVRECYNGLQCVFNKNFAERTRGVVVVGNPGIRLSFIAIFVTSMKTIEMQGSGKA
jgi:hypothetical protein